MLIIVLIALNQSPSDDGFSQPAAEPAMRRGGVMTSTVVFHHSETTSGGSSSDASSIDAGLEVGERHNVPLRGRPSSRAVLEKGEDQKEKDTSELA